MIIEKRRRLLFFSTVLFLVLGGLVAIGTLIPQGLSYVEYLELFGLRGANWILFLGFDDIYHHFLLWGLLAIFLGLLSYYLYLIKGHRFNFIFLGRASLHLGLALVLLASGVIALTSKEEAVSLSIGEHTHFKEASFQDLGLRLLDFEVDFYDDGLPKQYYAKVNLKTNKGEVTSRIKVNHPLYFKGYRIYQDSYAWEGLGVIYDSDKKTPFRLKLGETLAYKGGVFDTLVLPSYDAQTKSVGKPYPSSPHLLVRYQKEGEKEEVVIPYKKEAKLAGFRVRFDSYAPYSGLYLKSAKGLFILKLGYLSLVLGSFLLFIRRFKEKGGRSDD